MKPHTFLHPFPTPIHRTGIFKTQLKDLGQRLGKSLKPVVVCGTDIVRPHTPGLAAHLTRLLGEKADGARLFYVLTGPNAFGAGMLSSPEEPNPVLEILESGNIEALILVEQDPLWSYPDRERLEQALKKVEFLLVLDYLPSMAVERAQVVLPTCAHFERSPVSFINQEGRLQTAFAVHRGGTPISQVSGGEHPPRTFLDYISRAEIQRPPMKSWPNCTGHYRARGKKRFQWIFKRSLYEAFPVFKMSFGVLKWKARCSRRSSGNWLFSSKNGRSRHA
jgi:hypothetical protein